MKVVLIILFTILSGALGRASESRVIKLNTFNTVVFNQEIESISMDNMAAAIMGKRLLLPPEQTLYLVIISGGGYYRDALNMKAMLEVVPNLQVICKFCASAAGLVFASFKRHRLVISSSELLMHEMYVERVTARDVLNPSRLFSLVKSSNEFNTLMSQILGIPLSQYNARIAGTEWVESGIQLVKLKLADELVILKCDPYLSQMLPKTCQN